MLLIALALAVKGDASGAVRQIEGIVSSGGTGIPSVEILASGRVVAITGEDGSFSLSLPFSEGNELIFRHVGFYERRVVVPSSRNTTTNIEVSLEPWRRLDESITVTARRELSMIQRELSFTKIGRDELLSSPALNVAEAIDAVPGVSILRDNGEADEVFIRGMEPRLTSTMIDGERIPGTDGDDRTASLFLFPLGLLDSIEVQTTFSPEMDGDVIGGSVNLVTREAPHGGISRVHVGAGYDETSGRELVDAGFVYGRRHLLDRVGLLLSLEGDGGERGSERVEIAYDDASAERIELRDFDIDRRRIGGLLRVDYAPSAKSNLSTKFLSTEYGEEELRHRVTFDGESSSIFREIREGDVEKKVTSIDLSGAYVFAKPVRLGYGAGFFRSEEDVPERIDTIFALEEVEFGDAGVLDPVEEDLESFVLDEISIEREKAVDENLLGGLDVAIPVAFGGRPAEIRTGLKIRNKTKRQERTRTEFESDEAVYLLDFADPMSGDPGLIAGRPLGLLPRRGAADEILRRFVLEGERDLEAEAANYDATEESIAGYALIEADLGVGRSLLAGLRYERTESRYDGLMLTTIEQDGEEETILEPTSGGNRYDSLMPAVLLAMRLGDRSTVKMGLSRTFARPDYIHLVPFSQFDQDDREIERGNPELRVTRSWNVDLGWEWTASPALELSLAPYYKRIDDFIFESRTEVTFDGEEFRLIEPRNGDDARVFGVDLRVRHRLPPLSGLPEGLFYDCNISWSDSRATIPTRSGESLPFPGHAGVTGDLVIAYAAREFDLRLQGSYVGDQLLEIGESGMDDLYAAEHVRLDLFVRIPVSSEWEIFLRGSNLSDERVELYEGDRRRPTLMEHSGRSGNLGVRFVM